MTKESGIMHELEQFVKEKCGGDDLKSIVKGLITYRYDFIEENWLINLGDKPNRFSDQKPETQLAIAKLLGYEQRT